MESDDKSHINQPKTYEEQIQWFKNRGLIINDEVSANTILSKINDYRFSAYPLRSCIPWKYNI